MNADLGSEQDQDSFGAEFQNFYEIKLHEAIDSVGQAGDIIEVKGYNLNQFEYSIDDTSILIDKEKTEIIKKMIKAIK